MNSSGKSFYRATIRPLARRATLKALSVIQQISGQTAAARSVNRIQFLYLHHVFTDEETNFRRLLRQLALHYQFLSYSEAVARLWVGPIDAPYIVFSVDDGFKNSTNTARILEEFGIRACFFVCPSIVGETDGEKIKAFCAGRLHRPPIEFVSWDDIELLARMGHEIGGHTMNHVDLAHVPIAQAQHEIGDTFEILTRHMGRPCHFAWPYGRFSHITPAVIEHVFLAGFVSCASAERGCHVVPQPDRTKLCIRRDHVVAKWPLTETNYFVTRSSRTAAASNNFWPLP